MAVSTLGDCRDVILVVAKSGVIMQGRFHRPMGLVALAGGTGPTPLRARRRNVLDRSYERQKPVRLSVQPFRQRIIRQFTVDKL